VAQALGHTVAVFGERQAEFPALDFTVEPQRFDFVMFVVYMPFDFPDLPYLARLLDGVPKARRIVVDCVGRYNDTVRIEHDFNHLEKMEGHQGWEWIEAFGAVAVRVLQPTETPLRDDVIPFLFHAFEPASVARPYRSAAEAARAWAENGDRRYDVAYVGNNWQRWTQVRRFLEGIKPMRDELGRIALAGWDWKKRPDWAVELSIQGADVDPQLFAELRVETLDPVPYADVVPFLSRARFTPIFQRPLFNHLGLVSNRIFETFACDTLPLVFLPEKLTEQIYGPAVKPLVVGDDVAGLLRDMLRQPAVYWQAVLDVRRHLVDQHSFQHRLRQLEGILSGG
jgi:hypothetical protein